MAEPMTAEDIDEQIRLQEIKRQPDSARVSQDTEVVERDASGAPTVVRSPVTGTEYFTPASTPYQQGFRTREEQIKQQQVGAVLGVQEGRLIPEGTIITVTSAGKPYARYTAEQASGTVRPGLRVDIQDYLAKEQYRIPVTGADGKQKLLKPADVRKLDEITGEERFNFAKTLGLIEKGAAYIPEREAQRAERFAKADVLASKSEQTRFEKMNTKLPDGQYIAKADLTAIKKEAPEVYSLLTTRGFSAAETYITDYNRQVERQNEAAKNVAQVLNGDIPEQVSKADLIKSLWRSLTPWNEEAGQTYLEYMKQYPERVKATFLANIAYQGGAIRGDQTVLKQQYKAEQAEAKDAPLWARLLFPPTVYYDKGRDTYGIVIAGEAPMVGGGKTVTKTVERIAKVAVKERVNWKAVTDAIKRGEIKSATDAKRWQEIQKAFKPKPPLGRPRLRKADIREAVTGAQKRQSQYMERAKIKARPESVKARISARQAEAAATRRAIRQAGTQPVRVPTLAQIRTSPKIVPMLSPGLKRKLAGQTLTEVSPGVIQEVQREIQSKIMAGTILSNAIQEAVSTEGLTQTQLSQRIKELVQQQIEVLPDTATQTQTQTQTQIKEQVKQAIQMQTKLQTKLQPAEKTPETPSEPIPKPKKPPRLIKPPTAKQDKEARATILKAGGAIAWRQGKVGGKDRWDVITYPYASDSDYHMVLGEAPQGAAVAKGKRSAYRTAQVLRGQPPKKQVNVDSGIKDVAVIPSGKRIALRFTPDPQGLTKGDITIGTRKSIPLTDRPPRISSRSLRITPKRPRIGR